MPQAYEYKMFTNFTDRDFEFGYDGQQYKVKSGKTKIFASFIAEHAAKHLIDRELILAHNVSKLRTIPQLGDKKMRLEIYNKCVSDPEKLSEKITNMTKGGDEEEEKKVAAKKPAKAVVAA